MHQLKKYSFLLVVVVLLALVGASTALAQQIITTPNPLFFTQFGSELPLSSKLSVSCAFCGVQLSDVTATAAVTTPPGGNWLQVSPSAGTFSTPATLTVSVNTTDLPEGTYSGTITIASMTASNSPQLVPVSLTVPGSALVVSQSLLSFDHAIGGGPPAAQNLNISATGPALSDVTATAAVTTPIGGNWLLVSPSAGTFLTPETLTVSIDPTGLPVGLYTGTITIASSLATSSPQSVSVSLEVSLTGPGPTILVSQSSLSFAHQIGTELPAASNLQVSCLCFRGGQQIAVTATTAVTTPSGGNWLLVSPSAETFITPETLTVSIDTTGLPEGTYSGTITIASTAATNSPQSILVSLDVTESALVVSESSLSFAHQIDSESPAEQSLDVTATGPALSDVTATASVTTPPGGDWLLVSPSAETFNTPATLTVLVDTTGLPEGTYSGTITIASSVATNSPQSVSVSFTVTQPPALIPQINPGGIVNGASFRPAPAPVSPGSIISIFGSNLADDLQLASDVPLPTTLGNTSVSFNGIVAPLFAISDGQINAQVPFDILPGDVSVQVMRGSETSVAQPITVADVSPGIFSLNQQGTGQGAVLISNTAIFAAPSGSIPGQEARPANRLEFISIFCSGLGDVTNRPPSGMPPSGNGLSVTLATPTVTVGGVIVSPSFSGLTNFVGLYQVDVQVPSDAPTGDAVEVVVTIGGVSSNTVTIAVQ